MSFFHPLWLLALLTLPGAWALHRARHGRARRFAVRFPAARTLIAAAPAVPAWRRHLPALLAILAMAPLSVALARPRITRSVPVDRASIVLVTDHSGSMMAGDVDPNRLQAAEKAANSFVDELPARVRLGIVTYAGSVDTVQPPSTDHQRTRDVVGAQSAAGATATGDALKSALALLAREGKGVPGAIVLLSDGMTTQGADPVPVAAQAGGGRKVPIYTVALGRQGATVPNPDPTQPPIDVSPDRQTLEAIARVSGGGAFRADDSGNLRDIYERLGSRLGTRQVKREVTAGFAVGGLVLLLGSGLAANRRPVRIV